VKHRKEGSGLAIPHSLTMREWYETVGRDSLWRAAKAL